MKLFETIDALLVGTRYLGLAIAVLCIPCAAALAFANVGLGVASMLTFVAALIAAVGATLMLLPAKIDLGGRLPGKRRYVVGGALVAVAAVVMGLVYLVCGGFPAVNLLFV